MTTAPKLVIFDNDGVLVDSERLSNLIFAELLTAQGLPTSFTDSVDKYMGRRTTDCVVDIQAALGRPLPSGFIAEYERRCAESLRAELTTVDGVPELLDALDANRIPKCVASSGSPGEIALRLDVTGLAPRFGTDVFSGSMVPHGKPAPDLFELAARRMNTAPSDAVVIEDSVAGVTGAKAAGIRTIGHAALTAPDRLRAAGADHVVTSMSEVSELLGLTG